MQPQFFYFDLGKVLVDFDFRQMYRQIGAAACLDEEQVRAAVVDSGLTHRYECGQISDRQFYEAFCEATRSEVLPDALAAAACETFTFNLPMLPLVAQLRQSGCAMGVLSNTNSVHWEYCRHQYRLVAEGFDVYALSFRIGAVKPEAAIFLAAAELAGVRPEEIFFVDDLPQHVAGARSVGFDAVQFTTAEALAAELRRRGVRFNY